MAKTRLITGLDIGSNVIKALIAQKNPREENLQVLFQAQEISSGVRKGVVVSIEQVAGIIASCIKKAEKEFGQRR